ncbi:MAG: biotin--[acetyl-CoA-carboxylase] ligase [Chitinophagaceae bacterium]
MIGNPFVELEKVESTNNYAMEQVNQGFVSEGTTYFAWQQTGGKGQRGKLWLSEPNENITLSIVLHPNQILLKDQFLLSATVALGVWDFWVQLAGEETTIKWSNDIYWGDRKAGGILIENILRGNHWSHSIVGIGLNINQTEFSDSLPNPVSLQQITGKKWNVRWLAEALCKYLEGRYQQLLSGHFTSILRQYQEKMYRRDIPAHFKIGEEEVRGVIRGIDSDGKLRVEIQKNIKILDFGEIQFVI